MRKLEYIAEIKAELSGYPGTDKLIFKQGDQNMRYVIVTLLRNGVPISVSSDVTPRIHMHKPDGKQVITDDNVDILGDGTLKVRITPQMATAAGCGSLDIGLYKQGALLSSAVINVLVYPQAISMVKVASSDEYQALIDALGQIAPAIDAEKERVKNETERQNNEAIRQEALEVCRRVTEFAQTQGDYAKLWGTHAEKWGKYAEEHGTKIVNDFNEIKDIILSVDNGVLLEEIMQKLKQLEDLYGEMKIITDEEIDQIATGTYVDKNEYEGFFEYVTNEEIDDIANGTYIDKDEGGGSGISDSDIQGIIDKAF